MNARPLRSLLFFHSQWSFQIFIIARLTAETPAPFEAEHARDVQRSCGWHFLSLIQPQLPTIFPLSYSLHILLQNRLTVLVSPDMECVSIGPANPDIAGIGVCFCGRLSK